MLSSLSIGVRFSLKPIHIYPISQKLIRNFASTASTMSEAKRQRTDPQYELLYHPSKTFSTSISRTRSDLDIALLCPTMVCLAKQERTKLPLYNLFGWDIRRCSIIYRGMASARVSIVASFRQERKKMSKCTGLTLLQVSPEEANSSV